MRTVEEAEMALRVPDIDRQQHAADYPGPVTEARQYDARDARGRRFRREPPLYPPEPERRVATEDAERWSEEVLQPAVRRILWNALRRNRMPLASFAQGARLGVPIRLAVKTAA